MAELLSEAVSEMFCIGMGVINKAKLLGRLQTIM